MRNPAPLLLCVLFGSSASAEIYRWTDADGRVHFSDRLAPNAERVDVRVDAAPSRATATILGPQSPDAAYRGPYAALDILSPAADATLTADAAGVPISLQIDPAVIGGHRLFLRLDDSELAVEANQTQFKLTGLGAGQHRLQLQIKGAEDRLVAQSAPRTIQIRQPRTPGQLP